MTGKPAPTSERIWLCYIACVVIVALFTAGAGVEGHDPSLFLLVHAPILAAVLVSYWMASCRSHQAASWLRAGIAVIGLPTVFSALCWLLPAVHPEPHEFLWLEIDRWMFGDDLMNVVGVMPPWLVEVLQLNYVSFYFLCIAAALIARWQSGIEAFDRAVLLLVGGFLSSYLGYLLFPTIAPKVVFEQQPALVGLWLTDTLRSWIDGAEANPWDCFPSGHTMLTVTSLIILWRWARRWFWLLLVPGVALIASTMLLRYHWSIDVIAGALLSWPCVRLCDWLADRDGWPPAKAQDQRG